MGGVEAPAAEERGVGRGGGGRRAVAERPDEARGRHAEVPDPGGAAGELRRVAGEKSTHASGAEGKPRRSKSSQSRLALGLHACRSEQLRRRRAAGFLLPSGAGACSATRGASSRGALRCCCCCCGRTGRGARLAFVRARQRGGVARDVQLVGVEAAGGGEAGGVGVDDEREDVLRVEVGGGFGGGAADRLAV